MGAPNSDRRVLAVGIAGEGAVAAGLRDAGVAVGTADGVEDAREAVADGRVDGVVSARALPDGDGFELCGAVQAIDDLLPVVLHGDVPLAEVAGEAIAAGVAAYVRRREDGAHVAAVVDAVAAAVDDYRERRDRLLAADRGPTGVCLIRDGTVSYANPALGTLLGHEASALAGTPFVDLVSPDDRDRVDEWFEAVAPDEEHVVQFDGVCEGGERVAVEARWTAARGSSGDAVAGAVYEVAGRGERRADLARDGEMLDSLLENVPLSIYFKDRLSRHVRVSDYMIPDPDEYIENHEGKVHVHPADVIGKTDFDLYAPSFAEETIVDDRQVMEMEAPIVNEIEEGTTSLGETLYTATTKAPRYGEDGDVIGLVGVTLDVTEREMHEQELERQNERLDEFAEVLTHDLRNPLNIARGYLDLLADDHDEAHHGECVRAMDRMGRLIEEIRTFVLQGRTVESPEPVGLAGAAREAWRSVETADAELHVESRRSVRADPDRLRRVLENLFRNAVEHGSTSPRSQARGDAVEHGARRASGRSAPGDAVEHGSTSSRSDAHEDAVEPCSTSPRSQARGDVRKSDALSSQPESRRDSGDAVEHGGSGVTVRVGDLDDGFFVADDGVGVPDVDGDRLFERGFTTSDDGTGFGLAIVRNIADAHDWAVAAGESREGGARFEFTGVVRGEDTAGRPIA